MKILICDDHKLLREGLIQILRPVEKITYIGEAGTGEEVLKLMKNTAFDILILDIALPGKNGLEILATVKTLYPSTPVLMVSMHTQVQYAIRALKKGESRYLTKNVESDELIIAIRKIKNGGKYIAKDLVEEIADTAINGKDLQKHETLSEHEFDIMIKIANGQTPTQIGLEMNLSRNTISSLRSKILFKMHFETSADITKYCYEQKLIT